MQTSTSIFKQRQNADFNRRFKCYHHCRNILHEWSRKNALTKIELLRLLWEYCWLKNSVLWSSLLCPPYSGASESRAILYLRKPLRNFIPNIINKHKTINRTQVRWPENTHTHTFPSNLTFIGATIILCILAIRILCASQSPHKRIL